MTGWDTSVASQVEANFEPGIVMINGHEASSVWSTPGCGQDVVSP